MDSFRVATSHYMSRSWPRFRWLFCLTRPQLDKLRFHSPFVITTLIDCLFPNRLDTNVHAICICFYGSWCAIIHVILSAILIRQNIILLYINIPSERCTVIHMSQLSWSVLNFVAKISSEFWLAQNDISLRCEQNRFQWFSFDSTSTTRILLKYTSDVTVEVSYVWNGFQCSSVTYLLHAAHIGRTTAGRFSWPMIIYNAELVILLLVNFTPAGGPFRYHKTWNY